MTYLPFLIYPFLALAQFGLTLTAWVLAPFLAAYSVVNGVDTLPNRWQWWSTFDADLDGGIEQHEYANYYQDKRYPTAKEIGKEIMLWPWLIRIKCVRVWWYRTRWIWRNPAQGFGYHVFGVNAPKIRERWTTGKQEYGTSNSECYTAKDAKGRCYFSLKGKWWPVKWIGLRYYLGWKLTRTEERKMLVASLSIRFNKG